MKLLDEVLAMARPSTHAPPCLSLYQATLRRHPESRQNPVQFRNLVKSLEASLGARVAEAEVQALLSPLYALAEDAGFWKHMQDGLVVLRSAELFEATKLQRTVPNRAIVADTFHTKPLLRIRQSVDRYQVLGLNRQSARLFEGNRDALDEIELAAGVPRTIKDALGTELTEPHSTVASYGGVGAGRGAMHHGHGGKEAEVDVDAERFFRAVDRAVTEHHSRHARLPLILAALPEHHALFHRVSRNPQLVADSIGVHPDAVSIEALREQAWRVMEPQYLQELEELREAYGAAAAAGLGGGTLTDVATAIADARVATLLVEADRLIPGTVNAETGAVHYGTLHDPAVDDLLDDFAELALRQGARVVVVPADRMPTDTGVAAIYRF